MEAVAIVCSAKNTTTKTDGGAGNLKAGEQKGKNRLKSDIKASQTRESLASTITRNTRASHDPFLISSTSESRNGGGETVPSGARSRIQGIKRKRPDAQGQAQPLSTPQGLPTPNKHPKAEITLDKEEGKDGRNDGLENRNPTAIEAENTSDKGEESPPRLKTTLVEYDSD
ncbi:hypothetical protein O1611_g10221 [Lasiodiplodia mahajangana]|uniref:Uncharacterized protein n=1 Tax=Lasiodiplodia mahajangana TaxID=1108764 RepID=A0ACC2J0M1_9PEZI|nr:hypothetical protein O1611_g10221 [Lasiodiplodia mahajangana]